MSEASSGAPASSAPSAAPAAVAPAAIAPSQITAASKGAAATSPAAPSAAPAAKVEAAADKLDAQQIKTPKGEEKQYKVKVDGVEVTMNEAELIKQASLGKAGHKRMEENATLKKQIDNFLNLLKTDPKRVLSDPSIGLDVRKFAEEIISNEFEEMKKSPEQKEREKIQKELETLRKEKLEAEEARKQSEMSMLTEREVAKLDSDMTKALQSANLPKNPYIVKRIGDYMLTALQNNISVSVEDVLPLVKKEVSDDLRNLFSASSEDVLEEMIGRDSISKMRKRSIAKQKAAAPNASQVRQTVEGTKKPEAAPAKKMTMKDFLKM